MVNKSRVQRKLILMFGVILLLAFSCARSGGPTLRASDDGQMIELRKGQRLSISLEGNPTTGYTWEVVALDKRVLHQVGEPAFTPALEVVGAGGTHVLRLQAVGGGPHQVAFDLPSPLGGG